MRAALFRALFMACVIASSLHSEASRLVALSDVHGDLAQVQAGLSLAGIVDAAGHWMGGDAAVVQTGDIMDRGAQSLACLDFFEVRPELCGGRWTLRIAPPPPPVFA